MKKAVLLIAALAVCLILSASSASALTRVIIASTTSLQNTGLYDVLLPAYYKWTKLRDVRFDVVAVGTGKAIETARRGDADLLFVHDKEKEEAFVKDGYGVDRREVMYNDFVVLGPASDPAKVKGSNAAAEAFGRIAKSGAQFISRGDESGTHSREKKLWAAAGVKMPELKNYLSVGQGMEETLRIADEKAAYTLSDRSTYRTTMRSLTSLKILYEGDPALFNQYSVMAVNPAKYPKTHYTEALDFINFVTSTEGQKIIGDYKDGQSNKLFTPNAGK